MRTVSIARSMHERAWRGFNKDAACSKVTYSCSRVSRTLIRTRFGRSRSPCREVWMEVSGCWSHEGGESFVFERGLGELYAEARGMVVETRVNLVSDKAGNSLRLIHHQMLTGLARREWEVGARIFPPSAPARFQRGHYRLDATKRAGGGGALGVVCHFGSSEFLVRHLMLISEAVRRRIVDCAVLALITNDWKLYVTGRPARYEQAQRLLRAYGQSGFAGIPIVLWGLTPECTPRRPTHAGTDLQVTGRG